MLKVIPVFSRLTTREREFSIKVRHVLGWLNLSVDSFLFSADLKYLQQNIFIKCSKWLWRLSLNSLIANLWYDVALRFLKYLFLELLSTLTVPTTLCPEPQMANITITSRTKLPLCWHFYLIKTMTRFDSCSKKNRIAKAQSTSFSVGLRNF